MAAATADAIPSTTAILAESSLPATNASSAKPGSQELPAQSLQNQPTITTTLGERHEENQYLDLIRRILAEGEHRPDRTGTGTLSLFAPPQLRFKLSRYTKIHNPGVLEAFQFSNICHIFPPPRAPSPPPPFTHKPTPLSPPSPDPTSPSNPPISILPLLTTKRVHLKSILHELLWFISGSTSTTPLSTAGVKIWDGNGSRSFLDSVGLSHHPDGDLGPVYGFQWRHWGAEYRGASGGEGFKCTSNDTTAHQNGNGNNYGIQQESGKMNYQGKGVDQLKEIIRKLKENPYDRRIILSAWNVTDLNKMALPPCHILAQFYVSYPDAARGEAGLKAAREAASNPTPTVHNGTNGISTSTSTPTTPSKPRGRLSCQLYQRSCDTGLGIPFNIASYALLTHILAFAADLEPGEFIHVMGDAHVYLDHIEALKEQLAREPREFPEVRIRREEMGTGKKGDGVVDGWRAEEVEVLGYTPHGKIGMRMSV